jgi:hypothetical protein
MVSAVAGALAEDLNPDDYLRRPGTQLVSTRIVDGLEPEEDVGDDPCFTVGYAQIALGRSELTPREVLRLVRQAEALAQRTLDHNREAGTKLANALLDSKSGRLSGRQVERLIGTPVCPTPEVPGPRRGPGRPKKGE